MRRERSYAAAASESGSNGVTEVTEEASAKGKASESENGGAGGAADRVALFADPDAAHEMTPAMWTHLHPVGFNIKMKIRRGEERV